MDSRTSMAGRRLRRPSPSPGTPAKDVTLSWPTFSEAADEAGWSRRYGGIHFQSGDLHGRGVGAWARALAFITGATAG
jgi:hypothetical protein